jgi:hypothetical protein
MLRARDPPAHHHLPTIFVNLIGFGIIIPLLPFTRRRLARRR